MPEELTTHLYSLGAKLFADVCRSTSSVVTPTCISASPTEDKPWYLHRGKFAAKLHPTFHLGNQQGELLLFTSGGHGGRAVGHRKTRGRGGEEAPQRQSVDGSRVG